MTIAPEPYLSACLEVMHQAIIRLSEDERAQVRRWITLRLTAVLHRL
jgi:hypothetical protein